MFTITKVASLTLYSKCIMKGSSNDVFFSPSPDPGTPLPCMYVLDVFLLQHTLFKWWTIHQALQMPDNDLFIWIVCWSMETSKTCTAGVPFSFQYLTIVLRQTVNLPLKKSIHCSLNQPGPLHWKSTTWVQIYCVRFIVIWLNTLISDVPS